jgi:hypothetical protein
VQDSPESRRGDSNPGPPPDAWAVRDLTDGRFEVVALAIRD